MNHTIISSHEDWVEYEGKELGYSDFIRITQDQINHFAEATGDRQWIHTDIERAKKESPYNSTIAHGYLTVSLIPILLGQIIEARNTKMTVNYEIQDLRFNQPVLVDSEVRLNASVKEVKNLRGISKVTVSVTLEIRGQHKPAYTGSIVFLYHFK
ncbi:MAG TPA: MaoC family dehydratase [Balneolales bacterium]|nr:MaoC family dehydratase [Balneolales bacterium]